MSNIIGRGLLLLRRKILNKKEMEEMKEWKLILDYDFDESGSRPSPIDVSDYTEFMAVGIGLTNGSTSDSTINIYLNNAYSMTLQTQKKEGSSATKTQYIFGEYNGLCFRQYRAPQCSNNSGFYDHVYTNLTAPHSYSVMNSPLTNLSIEYTLTVYSCISGNLKVYAR